MSYVVTARRWRPQSFEEVVGQRHVCQTLQNAIRSQRIAHAYLFTGTRGVGKTTTARILAKALNCQEGPTPQPCNRCPSCREIAASSSLDVLEIDGASNRGIDEIRELRENARYTPAKGRYKIYIIDEVHMLTKEAFNALLKTLEEPPAHVIFLLATTEVDKLPPTILSRCQRFDLRMIATAEIVARLEEIVQRDGLALDPEGLRLIARKGRGSMRDAQSILDQVVSFVGAEKISREDLAELLGCVDQEWLFSLMERVVDRAPERVLELLQGRSVDRHDIRELCQQLLEYVRHLTVIKVSQDVGRLIDLPSGEIERMKGQSRKLGLEELSMLFQILLRAEAEMRYSVQPHLILEMALVKMALVRPVRGLEEILRQVEELEGRLEKGAVAAKPRIVEQYGVAVATEETQARETAAGSETVSGERAGAGAGESRSSGPQEVWPGVLGLLERNEHHPTLPSFLEKAAVKELDEEKIVLEVDAWCLPLVQGQDKCRAVEQAVQEVTGKLLQVKFLQREAPSEGPVAGVRQEERSTEWRGTQPLEGPVRDAWEIFGGRVIPQGSWPKATVPTEPAAEENVNANGGKEDEAS